MSVTLNAKGTSTSSFKVGKDGTIITQGGVISPPAASDLIIDIDQDQSLVIGVGNTGPALITATADQDLHINPAVGGGQYLLLNSTRWPTTAGASGQTLVSNGSGILSWTTLSGTGTVTSTSVVQANGFDGIVTTSTTTPAITLSTTVTGVLKGNGTSLLAANSGDITTTLGYTPVNKTGDTMTGNLQVLTSFDTDSGILIQNTSTGTNASATLGVLNTSGQLLGLQFYSPNHAVYPGQAWMGTDASAVPLYIGAGGTDDVSIWISGTTHNVGILKDSASTALDVNGTVTATTFAGPLTGAASLNVLKTGDTMTGQLVLNADPGSSLAAATKQYVDTEIAAVVSGINVHAASETATTAALATCTYNNGTSGVGATLTCDTNSALGTIGGYAGLNTTSRVLVKNQAAALQNGIYTVTSLGVDGVLPWILTRATDFDGSPTSEVQAGDMTYVQEGTLAGTQWVQTTVGTGTPGDYIVIGTNSIVFSQFAGAGTYNAGPGIDITSNTISNIGVTSAVAGTNIAVSAASGAVTFSVTGTVPNATTAVTATDNVLKTGDTMTGDLLINRAVNNLSGIQITNSTTGTAASADIILTNNAGKSIGVEVTSSTYGSGFANQGWIYTDGTIPFQFTTAGTSQMTLDTAGNLGLGTTTPTNFGAGWTSVSVNDTTGAAFDIMTNGSRVGTLLADTSELRLQALGASIPINFWTNGAERVRINTAGAIGFNGANYGTNGQVLTSQGSSSSPQWATPSLGAPTIVIVSGTSQSGTGGNQYVLTNTEAATTVTLPASPTDGDIIWITNVTLRTDHVIARNGKILQGSTTDMTINLANVNVQLRFINTTIGWRIL